MKRFLTLFAIICLYVPCCYAVGKNDDLGEVLLEDALIKSVPEEDIVDLKEKTFSEKLQDVYHLEINNNDEVSYLFKDITTKKFDEKSPMESLHLWAAYNGFWDASFYQDGNTTNTYNTNFIRVTLDGKMKNDVNFRVMLGPPVNSDHSFMQDLFQDVYISTGKIPHHELKVGRFRPAAGMEGRTTGILLPFMGRSQIARTFSSARKNGINLHGDYSLVEYDLGAFSSDTYCHTFFPGAEFDGWVNFKPLGKTDGKYGKLILGGGLQAGRRDINYTVLGAYADYQYKKFEAEFEWASADGYNGSLGTAMDKKADGFYATLKYMITPKLQLCACYDQFSPDKSVSGAKNREYTVGFNYFLKGQALKFILDYVFCQYDSEQNSHKVLLGTQIIL